MGKNYERHRNVFLKGEVYSCLGVDTQDPLILQAIIEDRRGNSGYNPEIIVKNYDDGTERRISYTELENIVRSKI